MKRWQTARHAARATLREADPSQPHAWAAASLKPRTLARTRLAEYRAHALDSTGPLGIDHPDTARLAHIAWLGHSTLPYAFALAEEPPHVVYGELPPPMEPLGISAAQGRHVVPATRPESASLTSATPGGLPPCCGTRTSGTPGRRHPLGRSVAACSVLDQSA